MVAVTGVGPLTASTSLLYFLSWLLQLTQGPAPLHLHTSLKQQAYPRDLDYF